MNQRDPFALRSGAAISVLQAGKSTQPRSKLSRPSIDSVPEEETGSADDQEPSRRHATPDKDSMSFSRPGNVPSFTDPQRRMEDMRWASSGMGNGRHTVRNTTSGQRMGGFFEKRELPMYKDKPYGYAPSNRLRRWWRRKRVIVGGLLLFIGLFYWLGWFTSPRMLQGGSQQQGLAGFGWLTRGGRGSVDWSGRRERVKEAFILSWDAYERDAWGMLSLPA